MNDFIMNDFIRHSTHWGATKSVRNVSINKIWFITRDTLGEETWERLTEGVWHTLWQTEENISLPNENVH